MTNPPTFLFGHGLPQVLPLAGLHIELGCHPGPAHGYTVPLWYQSPLEEQVATRQRAGLFDRSYLGQHYVTGERAAHVLDRVLATDPARVPVGHVSRAVACRDNGTIIDLPLLAHLDDARWLLLAGPGGHQLAHAIEEAGANDDVLVHDRSMYATVLSLQGPAARLIAGDVLGADLVASVPPGAAREFLLGLHRAAVLAASDVGEDGLILVVEPGTAGDIWRGLLAAGATSAGLIAHDALRLEAGTLEAPLETPRPATPAAAGLDALVDLDGAPATEAAGRPRTFPGSDALRTARPPERRLATLRLDGPRLAKPGSRVRVAGFDIGACVAAGWSSLLDAPLAVAYLAPALDHLEVDCDGVWQPATRVPPPRS